MGHMEHATYVPLLAFLVSCMGCGLGLVCTRQARVGPRGSRNRWLILSALSIGGTGIWAMHFVAMLGVTVHGSKVRWDIGLTVLSLAIAIAVVGVGMFMVSYGAPKMRTLLLAGGLTGCGVAAMHYTGMMAMRVQGSIQYDIRLVAASVAIAIAAATAALWITKNVRRAFAMVAAIPVMALAVCGMHYTGMAATTVVLNADAPIPAGAEVSVFTWPLIIWIMACPVVTLATVALAPSGEEILEEEYLREIAARMRRD